MHENRFSYPLIKELNMYYCGKRNRTANHVYGPEIRTHFIMVLIKEGSGTFFRGEKRIRMHAGDILFMFPNERVYYEADKDVLWTISWIGVYGTCLRGYLDMLKVTPDDPFIRDVDTNTIGEMFEKIYQLSFSDSVSDKIRCISYLYRLFSIVLKKEKVYDNADYVDEAKHIINLNYDTDLKVTTISEMLHLSPCYLSRIFKAKTGVSPKKYILDKKIERASSLLSTGNYKIMEVAFSVGITDQLYFSKIFKKKIGCSPSDFVKKAVEG